MRPYPSSTRTAFARTHSGSRLLYWRKVREVSAVALEGGDEMVARRIGCEQRWHTNWSAGESSSSTLLPNP